MFVMYQYLVFKHLSILYMNIYMNLFHPIIRSFIRYYNAIHLEVNF